MILAAITAALLILPLLIALALFRETPVHPDPPPSWTVLQFEQAALQGDWKTAHRLMNYDARGRELAGELWERATPAQREGFTVWMKAHWRTRWSADGVTALGPEISETAMTGDTVEVRIGVTTPRVYRCEREGSRWAIVGRTDGNPGFDSAKHLTALALAMRARAQGLPDLGALTAAAPPPPAAVLLEMDENARAGRWESVHAHFDYRAKGRAMVPKLWDAATEHERSALIDWLRYLFEKTWEKNHASEAFRTGTTIETVVEGTTTAVVSQSGWHNGVQHGMNHYMRWDGARWVVFDRTRTRAGLEYKTKHLVKRILGKITNQLGREPNLSEFVANAPSWNAAYRQRRMRIGEPPAKKSP